jgi:hypothetical protein
VRSSSAPVRRLNPTISTARIAASFRVSKSEAFAPRAATGRFDISPRCRGMSTFCAFETVKATSRIDVKRTLRIAAVDVAAGRGWTARSQGDGRLSPIKSRLALALKMLQALPCFNSRAGQRKLAPTRARCEGNPHAKTTGRRRGGRDLRKRRGSPYRTTNQRLR